MTAATLNPPMSGPQLVLDELNHRFLNSLQVIATLAAVTPTEAEAGVSTRLQRLRTCIGALGAVHRLLANPIIPDVEDGAAEVCCALAAAFDRRVYVDLRVDSEPEDASLRRGLLLLVVELVTNALKHGSSEALAIQIALEFGVGGWRLTVRSSTRATSGKPRVATALAEWLGGALEVDLINDFTVRVTLPARA